jgi:putrescine transport system substrate-binding protein
VLYANPIPASAPFIRPDIRANRTVFMPREDLARMVPPEIMQNAAIRRLRTRLYTTFKTAM